MSGRPRLRCEPLTATALLLLGLLSSAWMSAEAAEVTGRARARELQLEQLRALVSAIDQPSDPGSVTQSLQGLFPVHHVVWLQTSAGPVLAVAAHGAGRAE